VLGYVIRHRGEYVTAFHLHREDTGAFVMAASFSADKTGKVIFHTMQDSYQRTMAQLPRNEDSAVYLGMMDADSVGIKFTIHDHRVVDTKSSNRNVHDLGLVIYKSNVLGRYPNSMQILVPRKSESSVLDDKKKQQSILERYKVLKQGRKKESLTRRLSNEFMKFKERTSRSSMGSSRGFSAPGSFDDDDTDEQYRAVEQDDLADLLAFQTRQPVWNEDLLAWTLNFDGRVKLASKKNFLIKIEEDNYWMEQEFDDSDDFLRFGKVRKTRFTLDYRYPMSPTVALGICISTFVKKLAVT